MKKDSKKENVDFYKDRVFVEDSILRWSDKNSQSANIVNFDHELLLGNF